MQIRLAVLVVTLLSGCAMGNRIQYSGAGADVAASGDASVVVATHDQRPYVISGDKPASFVGLQRGGYGNPFNVTTESGGPLAADFTAAIVSALAAQGFAAKPLAVAHSEGIAAVTRRLGAEQADRTVLVTLREWKSDTYNNTALLFDVTVSVSDGAGRQLASERFSGREDLGGSFMNPPAHAKKAVPEAFKRKLGEWFSNPDIVAALKG